MRLASTKASAACGEADPETLEQGVDETEKSAIMGGSLGRKRWVDGKGAEADSSSSLKVCAGNLCGRLQEG